MESIQASRVLSGTGDKGGTVAGVIDQIARTADGVRDAVRATAADLATLPGVQTVTTPYDTGAPPARAAAQIAKDNRAIIVRIQLKKLDKLARHDAAAAASDRLRTLADRLASA